MPKIGNDELVAVAFFKANIGTMFATRLPGPDGWVNTGFGVVSSVQPTTADIYSPARESILQVDTYGVRLNQIDPDWERAADLAVEVQELQWESTVLHQALTLRDGYNQAKVMNFSVMAGPRRDTSDPNGYAKYQTDVSLTWVDLGE